MLLRGDERRRAVLGAAGLALGLGAAACGGGGSSSGGGGGSAPEPGCKLGFLGDASKPVEMKLITRGADPSATELTEGGMVPMILPPQGGRVILVGVSATNLDACGADLKGVLRDGTTSQIRVDQRTINLKPGDDGWGGSVPSDISTFANVPTCPNQWASTDIFGHSFELVVTLTDRAGNKATETRMVVPFCAEPENAMECACECQKGYVLGQHCE